MTRYLSGRASLAHEVVAWNPTQAKFLYEFENSWLKMNVMYMFIHTDTHIYIYVSTYTVAHMYMMYNYTLLVPTNRRVLNELNKERNISSHK